MAPTYTPRPTESGYPKGLAVDDRGYLYVGLAYYPNNGSVDFAVVSYNDKGEMTEISYTNLMSSPKLCINSFRHIVQEAA